MHSPFWRGAHSNKTNLRKGTQTKCIFKNASSKTWSAVSLSKRKGVANKRERTNHVPRWPKPTAETTDEQTTNRKHGEYNFCIRKQQTSSNRKKSDRQSTKSDNQQKPKQNDPCLFLIFDKSFEEGVEASKRVISLFSCDKPEITSGIKKTFFLKWAYPGLFLFLFVFYACQNSSKIW